MRAWGPLCIGALIACPARAAAQAGCPPTSTIGECWDVVSGAKGKERTDSAQRTEAAQLDRRLQGKTAGLASLGGPFASAINDFLPRLAGALGVTTASDPQGTTTLETNLPVALGVRPQRVRLQGVLRHPVLYTPLVDALPASTREETRLALEKELGDFDDVELVAAFNLETPRFGRSFANHVGGYSALFQDAWSDANETAKLLGFLRIFPIDSADLGPATRDDPRCNVDLNSEAATLPMFCIDSVRRARITNALVAAAKGEAAIDRALGDRMRSSGFFLFADLINNQPQVDLRGSARLRHGQVGPDEYGASGRFEWGFVNVNSLRRRCGAEGITLPCLERYLKDPSVRAALQRGDRVWVAAEWRNRHEFVVQTPAALALAATSTVSLTGGLGRYVGGGGDTEAGRVDLSAELQLASQGAVRNDRILVTANYTQRVSAELALLVGFTYANKPEFVTDVDRKVTANFGLRYRLLSSSTPAAGAAQP